MRFDLTQPGPRASTLGQAQELVDELWLVVCKQAQRIEALEQEVKTLKEQLHTNSRNSSQPPASDPPQQRYPQSRPGSGRKAGGQSGHLGKGRVFIPEEQITHRQDCYPPSRCACGGLIEAGPVHRRHQVLELPRIAPTVTQYRLYAGRCQQCGQYHEAALPPGVPPYVTGPRLLALIGLLTGGYRLSKRLVQGLLQDVFHLELSLGAISQSEARLSAALAPLVDEAHHYVQQAAVVHADETSHREKQELQWMWIAIACVVSVFKVQACRSTQAAKALLGEFFAGILVSDRYAAYNWVDLQRRQLCWAHLLRDFTKIAEREGSAGRIGRVLVENTHRMFSFWYHVREGTLSRADFAMHMLFLRHQIETALQHGSQCDDAKTAQTCQHVLKMKAALWTFIETPGVEPTNNLAERTLRSYVIWRKISLGAQSRRGSVYIERVMTVVGSCKLQGRNILHFLTQAVQAGVGQGEQPSLVPVAAT